jgi:hypothetical protein
MCDGVAWFNIETLSLECGSYTTGTGEIREAHLLEIYRIPKNLDLESGDLATEEEIEMAEEEEKSVRSILRRGELVEREIQALVSYAEDEFWGEWWVRFEKELSEIYSDP